MRRNEESLRVTAVGDIAFVGDYNTYLTRSSDYPFTRVASLLRKADFVIANLEGPLTTHDDYLPQKCCLKGHPDYAETLKEAGVNVLSLGNNHILDYGERGVADSLSVLRGQGISYVGYGETLEKARSPLVLDRNGIRLGILSYCDVVIDSPFYASATTRGIAPLKLSEARSDIERLRKSVDYIVLSLHWGYENYRYPSPSQVEQGRKLIEAGADVILGHHAHVLQGIERYRNGYIVYNLGNFVFAETAWSLKTKDGQILPQRLVVPDDWKRSAAVSFVFSSRGVVLESVNHLRIDGDLSVCRDEDSSCATSLPKSPQGINILFYRVFWTFVVAVTEWRVRLKPFLQSLSVSRLRRIRPRHLKTGLQALCYVCGFTRSPENN